VIQYLPLLLATVVAAPTASTDRSDETAAAIAVIDAHLKAYNAHDLEALLAFFAPDGELYEFPDKLLAKGSDAIRARYAARLAEPNLHARVASRVAVGNTVIDEEHITRTFPGEGPGTIEVAAISEVKGGKITRAWFINGKKTLTPK
jgi:uncharacterized protein (TIGR02246 family)